MTQHISLLLQPSDRPHRYVAILALAVLCFGCSRSPDELPRQTSEAVNDVKAAPSNEQSYALLFVDDATRHARMKLLFDRSGKVCQEVTQAVFMGGLDGTDEWAVACSDSGAWRVWFKPGAFIAFDQCTKGVCA